MKFVLCQQRHNNHSREKQRKKRRKSNIKSKTKQCAAFIDEHFVLVKYKNKQRIFFQTHPKNNKNKNICWG